MEKKKNEKNEKNLINFSDIWTELMKSTLLFKS